MRRLIPNPEPNENHHGVLNVSKEPEAEHPTPEAASVKTYSSDSE